MTQTAATPARPSRFVDWGSTDAWVRLGGLLVVVLVGGLALWSMLVSISGAVVATGSVTVESNYKTVAHLDGGIVAKILVRNGDRVKQGDALVRLDPTTAQSTLAVTVARGNDLLIQQTRLEAERDRRDGFAVPAEIKTPLAPQLRKIADSQLALFEARRRTRLGEQAVLDERRQQAESDLVGLTSQLAAKKNEAALTKKELDGLLPLFEKGFANQQRLSPLQKDAARLEGEIGRLRSDVARVKSQLAEIKLRMAQAEKEFTQTVVDELRKTQAALAEVQESRVALEDKLARVEIRAPRAGRVHALAVHTEGGVIQPASPLLQIIPEGEKLIVEAQVQPQDIDKIRRGQAATVRFPAFNARTTPKLDGTVATISAAQLTDNQNRSYFTAQIEVSSEALAKLAIGHELVPGMPAEVYIETESRSVASYLVKPLTDALYRTFREP